MSEGDPAGMLVIWARDSPDVLRMKVVGKSEMRRRRIYRVELLRGRESLWAGSTTVPVNTIEPAVGMQEAWALTHEADRLWDNKTGEWVAFVITPPMTEVVGLHQSRHIR